MKSWRSRSRTKPTCRSSAVSTWRARYICQQAILGGRIDIYPEYTGTALTAILKEQPSSNPAEVYNRVKTEYAQRFNLELGQPFGFNNTFAIEIRGEDARRLGLKTISQAAAYTPKWRAGFGYEFTGRPDGYKGLAATYGLRFAETPSVMDLGLLARALTSKQIDLAAGNMTDGLIPVLDLFVLEDDRHYFPPYEAVPIIRQEMLAHHPGVAQALHELAGKISDEDMRQLNYALDGQHRDVKEVVREFLRQKGFDSDFLRAPVSFVVKAFAAIQGLHHKDTEVHEGSYINHTASTSTITCERGIFCWAAYASMVLSKAFSFSRLADFTTKWYR